MFRSALLILSGNAAASVLLLARNLIIARLITVEDYGIAATFAIAMAVVEMMSALGLQQQIVQSKDGDDPHFQAALQGFQLFRGLIAAAILFVSAGAIARFLNIPDVAWAYQVMALVPLFNALQHFDIHRLNRQMRFWPMVLTGGVPALVSLALVWPLYRIFGDYQVMLWSIITQIALMMVVSHLVAERPYRLVFDGAIMRRSLAFGWPLLINGILMFAVFNGDKLIVGRLLGMETLAIFAMGITLTLTPTLVMAKSAQNFFLPQLSKPHIDTTDFDRLARTTLQVSLLNGGLLVIGTVLLGVPFVQLVLGTKYDPLLPLMVWFAIVQAIRVFKAGPAVVALSKGHSGNAMIANLVRVATLPLIWVALEQGGGVLMAIWIGTLGEIGGYAVSLWLVRRSTGVGLRPMVGPLLAMAAILAAAAGGVWFADPLLITLSKITLFVSALVCVMLMSDLRGYIRQRKAGLE